MKEERKNFALVECNNKLHAIGGRNNEGDSLLSIETYNKKTNSWTHTIDMTHSRFCHRATCFGDDIFIFAGRRGAERYSNAIDIFNTRTNEFSELNFKLKIGRINFACCRLNDLFFLIGGSKKGGYANEVEIYNLKTNSLIFASLFIENDVPYSDTYLSACTLYE